LDFRVELATLKKLFTVTPIVICLGRYWNYYCALSFKIFQEL
jgi:hypothetical protein